jgi:uncharacterized repeat protein (TIGR02543 family)
MLFEVQEMYSSLKKKVLPILVLLLISTFSFSACSKVDFKVAFMVDGEVYHTLNTNGRETIKMPADPTKEGYEFDGWFWDKDTWERDFTANSLLNEPLSGDMSVYAKWKPVNVAADNGHSTSNLQYILSNGTYTVAKATSEINGAVFIPDYYQGLPVKTIANNAFRDCAGLTSVTIGNSVTSIGDWAFGYCSSLTGVVIGNSVMSIGSSAFGGCSSLTSIVIPDSVISIGSSAFGGCSSLTSIVIPGNVTSIEGRTFLGCSNLTSIQISSNVTSIGDFAFSGCSSLTSIVIPHSVTSIGSNAFNYTAFYNNTAHNSVVYAGNWAIGYKGTVTNVVIVKGTKGIADAAFSDCSSLTSIVIPDSVTSISGNAFYNCSSLKSVTIGNGVTSIGSNMFYNCSSLTSVTIGNGVTSIGDFAFYDYPGLTSVTIGNGVTSIGSSAFSYCSRLTSLTVNATNPPLLENDVLYYTSSSLKIYVPSASVSAYKAANGWRGYASKIFAIS